jgi:hypothetical protein
LNFQREIRKFRRSFDFPAEVLIFQPTTLFSAEDLDFPQNIAIFQRDFFFFRRTFYSSAELFNFPVAFSTIR